VTTRGGWATSPTRASRTLAPAARLWPTDRPTQLAWPVWTLVLAAGSIVALLRVDWGRPLQTVWGEDGAVFLSEAESMSTQDVLLHPYAGYAHMVPRLVAEIATVLPLSWADTVFAVAAGLVTTALGILVFQATSGHILSTLLRAAVATYFVLPPIGSEVFGVTANIHWFLLPAAFCVALWRPRSWTAELTGAAVLLLAAVSDPFVVLVLPLLALRLLFVGRRGWVFAIAGGLGCLIQLVVMAGAPARAVEPAFAPFRIGAWYAARGLPGALLGEGIVGEGGGGLDHGWLAVGAATTLALALLVWFSLRSPWSYRVRPFVVVCLTAALSVYALLVSGAGTVVDRYAVPSAMLLVLALAALLDAWLAGRPLLSTLPRSGRGVLLTAAMGAFVFGWLVALPVTGHRAARPLDWDPTLTESSGSCRSGMVHVDVPINPQGWTARLPCAAIAARADAQPGRP
jgi:hypothetical protein